MGGERKGEDKGRTYDAAFCILVIGVPAYAHNHRPDITLRLHLCIPICFPLPVNLIPLTIAIATWFPLLINVNTRPAVVYSALYILIPAYA